MLIIGINYKYGLRHDIILHDIWHEKCCIVAYLIWYKTEWKSHAFWFWNLKNELLIKLNFLQFCQQQNTVTKTDLNRTVDGNPLKKMTVERCCRVKVNTLQQKIRLDSSKPFVQILHAYSDHWITIYNLCCKMGVIYVYDSVYNNINSEVRQLIDNMCGSHNSVVMYNDMP